MSCMTGSCAELVVALNEIISIETDCSIARPLFLGHHEQIHSMDLLLYCANGDDRLILFCND